MMIPSDPPCQRSSVAGTGTKGAHLTLRDQQKHIDNLIKENFTIKLRVHFLEEQVQQRGIELKKLKKLVGAGGAGGVSRREREVRKLGRRAGEGDVALREAEAHNALLKEELENVKGLLENTDEMERLKEIVEERGGEDAFNSGSGALKRRIKDLKALQTNLPNPNARSNPKRKRRPSRRDRIALPRHRRTPPRPRRRILEEREEREAVEDDLNSSLAAVTVELQQREEAVEMKEREIEELVGEHGRIVEVVEREWRGEVEELEGKLKSFAMSVLAERETESKELRLNISELEANTNDLHEKFEQALAHLEQESDEKD
ncbi:hypothetical protein PILCRDRAFT_16577, partial [Piloderma croceum F 1598]